jgi:signal transduction histidine kinase
MAIPSRLRHRLLPIGSWRSYSLRITLLYFAVLGAAVLVLFGVIYAVTANFMEKQLRDAVRSEQSLLVDALDAGGVDALATSIKRRSGIPGHTPNYYLLQDPSGTVIAGNLPARAAAPGWVEFAIPSDLDPGEIDDDGEVDTLLARGEVLANGWFLLVGKNTDRFGDYEDQILRIAGASLGGVFVLAVLGGWAMSGSMLRRLGVISEASAEIMRGNLARRIALRGSGDEFDRLSANLNEMLERIQNLMEGMRQVSNDIAHDLRTPLARLRQGLEAARDKAESAADFRAAVETAIAETDEILGTFGALLRIAQIETGARRAEFTAVDLSGLTQGLLETYAPVADDHGQMLSGRIDPGITVRGDRALLTQMLANVIENAIRHTPAQTSIELKLAVTARGPVCLVRDDGPGIPAPERKKVFRRFYRLDASRSTTGNGLGLSLVAAVADLHRIAIELEDAGPGVCMVLQFL